MGQILAMQKISYKLPYTQNFKCLYLSKTNKGAKEVLLPLLYSE